MYKISPRLISFLFIFCLSTQGRARELVSPETIQLQTQQTNQFLLSNGLSVVYRKVPDSEIIWLALSFSQGASSLKADEAPLLNTVAQIMEKGSETYPRDRLYALFEKFGTGVNCGFGVESGMCQATFVKQYAGDVLPIFASLVTEPKFEPAEVDIALQQARAANLAANQNPEDYVNEVVNEIFYGQNHPYWRSNAFEKAVLAKAQLKDLKALYKKMMASTGKRLVVVGSMPDDQLKELLEKSFLKINSHATTLTPPKAPRFAKSKDISIVDRDVPTAYLRAKFLVPGALDKDFIRSSLMLHILSEELETEVRTRRSLSYAVYAGQLSYSLGIGILHASTSRPKETLEAMAEVIKNLRTKLISKEDLERYKTVFATSYFLNLEDHGRLGSSLANAYHYHGGPQKLYEYPRVLAQVTPEDIRRVADAYLRQFRLGIVYKKAQFKEADAKAFLKQFP